MAEEFASVNTQEVATPVEEAIESIEEVNTSAGENEQEVAETAKTEQNRYYADKRRKQENDELKAEIARLKRENEFSYNAMRQYFDGDTLEELTDNAMAQALGISTEDYRNQRIEETSAKERQALLEAELNGYRQAELKRVMDEDLKAIQRIDASITSLDDVNPMFLTLRFNENNPLTAEQAFIAVKEIERQTRAAKPTSTGSMTGTGSVESEYFTEEQVEKLTDADLNNPKIMEKVMKSMSRWK